MNQTQLRPHISSSIITWYQAHRRDLPWRNTHDAYLIWLSEIILQQTRVAQGYCYYMSFAQTFPNVEALANASIDDVMKLWQGLGYYSRARNLHTAAQQVMSEYKGVFPTTYKELIKLKGIGPYTAAAIASFSSDEAVAVVDGNVYRVLSRLFDIDIPIDTTEGTKTFAAIAQSLLDSHQAGLHNQAMMEFGALQCTPSNPDCVACPLQDYCMSLANKTSNQRPVKSQKVIVRDRYLHYLIFVHDNHILVHKRQTKDIWQGLYEFVLNEQPQQSDIDFILKDTISADFLPQITTITPLLLNVKHQLTHQTIHADFYVVETKKQISVKELNTKNKEDYFTILVNQWSELAVPKLISIASFEFFRLISCNNENNI